MLKAAFWKFAIRVGLILTASFLGTASFEAQTSKIAAAPVPGAITSSRKIFISNGGDSCAAVKQLGQGPDVAYDEFYAAMKAWGHYDLTASPEEADLVFEIRFDCPLFTTGSNLDTYDPRFRLRIIDPKENTVLWTITEHIEGAFRTSTAQKNFAAGVAATVTDLKTITGSSSAAPAPSPQ